MIDNMLFGKECDEQLRLNLLKFFSLKENLEKLVAVLSRSSISNAVSLRLLDYFCVTYCKNRSISININGNNFDCYTSYKNQLSSLSKKKFDPFRRNSRFPILYNGKTYITTIAQLSFFRWALQHRVLEYVEKYKVEITKDMKNVLECEKDCKIGKNIYKKKQNVPVCSRSKSEGVAIISFN